MKKICYLCTLWIVSQSYENSWTGIVVGCDLLAWFPVWSDLPCELILVGIGNGKRKEKQSLAVVMCVYSDR